MTDNELNPDDADQLRDLAGRNERAAATARRIKSDDRRLSEWLTVFAWLAEQAAQAARAIASAVDLDGDDGQ